MARTIAVIGLGYVGLPLAVEFGKRHPTFGFDNSPARLHALRNGTDPSGEISVESLGSAVHLSFHDDPAVLRSADFIIVAVPTPVDDAHRPDFGPLIDSTRMVGGNLKPGATVIYESTVFPGATEEICIPILEESSGMKWKQGFFVGYSPERVNPGDKERTLAKVVKIVSGDSPETLEAVVGLYREIITAGVHPVTSIKVAEAAKVIENTQRDLNIALMNELAIIFHKLGIDTMEVLEAAGTKWNFLNFRPGLVGGHCIGVDPYYLTHKAETLGYHPHVILAGRSINDSMAAYVAQQIIKAIIRAGGPVKGSKLAVLGLTFKENCKDIRNSKVADLVNELIEYGCQVSVHDPVADPEEAAAEYGIHLTPWDLLEDGMDAVVVAVPHRQYLSESVDVLLAHLKEGGAFFDVKSAFASALIGEKGYKVWRL